MVSRVLKASQTPASAQLSLNFDPDLHERYGSLRECCAQGIYQRGLTKVAPSLNKAPGNLSVELSEDPARHFSVDSLEAYIERFDDTTPIYYLISKFLAPSNPTNVNAAAVLASVRQMLRNAGLEA